MTSSLAATRHRSELARDEALRLVGTVPFGRVGFTIRALPAIQPVAHLLAGTQIIIRARLGAAFSSAVPGTGTVVAYQADHIDPDRRAGWSVAIVGRAQRVTSEARAARFREELPPWLDDEMDDVIAIDADLVTGFRIVPRLAADRRPPSMPDVNVAESWQRPRQAYCEPHGGHDG